MLIRFRIDESGFRCVDAPVLANATEIDYIKCHFEFKSEAWKNVQAVLAIFKSATYNKTSEILLDSNGDCYIDPEVYKKGGVIQCKVFGDKYRSDSVNSSSSITEVVAFYINENLTLPTPVPSKYDAFLAEYLRAREVLENVVTEVETKLENGEFDGVDGIGISSVVYNSDGTLTIALSDGSSFVSEYSMKGESGTDGVGISNVAFGQDGTVTVTLSNGVTFTSEYSFKGEKGDRGDQGESGADGVGIESITFNNDYTMTIVLTDGTSFTSNSLRGAQGEQGVQGIRGETGPQGIQGVKGDTGNGIVSITKTSTVGLVDTYTILYTDGTTSTFNVTNGANGSGSVADVWVNGASVLDGDTAKVIVPTKVSDLSNDSGFITGYTESDPIFQASAASGITAAKILAWDNKSDFSGNYNDLINKPSFKTVTGQSVTGSGDIIPASIQYTTIVPTAINTDGLKFVLCSSEPATKYDGWVYLIEES